MSAAGSKPVQQYHIPIASFLNALVRRICETTAWFNVILIIVIIAQVILRYGFNQGLVPLEELMWHFYAIAFMFGMAYSITNDTHIRVDLVHMRLKPKTQHWVEIIGIITLLLPCMIILLDHSIDWVISAYEVGESSTSPQGLSHRWIIKSVIPLSCLLIIIAAIARLIQEIVFLTQLYKPHSDDFIDPSYAQSQEPGKVSMLKHLFAPQLKTPSETSAQSKANKENNHV